MRNLHAKTDAVKRDGRWCDARWLALPPAAHASPLGLVAECGSDAGLFRINRLELVSPEGIVPAGATIGERRVPETFRATPI
jgi:hypothetical protein